MLMMRVFSLKKEASTKLKIFKMTNSPHSVNGSLIKSHKFILGRESIEHSVF